MLGVLFVFLFHHKYSAQSVTGFLSIKQTTAALGCGCTGCNDAAYIAGVNYPDLNGGCGTTEPTGNSGNCGTLSKTVAIAVPAGCTVNVTGCMGDRTGCSGGTHGPGMDGGDAFSMVGSGGTLNGNSGTQTGSSNANVCASITQVGGVVTFSLTANRVSELLTYTMSFTGPACTPGPLPVELVNFDVVQGDNEFNAEWITLSEKNSSNFELEYSEDAVNFSKISTIEAAGNSHGIKVYKKSFPDVFKTNALYFRLRQNDKDGTFNYSQIIYLASDVAGNFKIMPNPTETGILAISANQKADLNTVVEVLDYTGKKVMKDVFQFPVMYVNLANYGKGVYMVHINSKDVSVVYKVIYF